MVRLVRIYVRENGVYKLREACNGNDQIMIDLQTL